MSCWFLLSTALLLQSASFVYSVRTGRPPWTVVPTGMHKTIKNHCNSVDASGNKYSPLLRVFALRGGDVSNDNNDDGRNNSRRRRKRKRVLQDPPSSTTVEKGDELADDDATVIISTGSDAVPETKKGKRKRRRRLFSATEDDVDPSIDTGSADQEDVVTTTSIETAKTKKRRRRKVAATADDGDPEKELEIQTNEDVGVVVEDIPEIGAVDTPSRDESNKIDNTEASKATIEAKKRKRKKRTNRKIAQADTTDTIVLDEDMPNDLITPASSLPSMDAPIDPSDEETRSKKRKRRRRGAKRSDQDTSYDNIKEEETLKANDPSPLPMIDVSVEIPSQEIVPESIGSSIEVDESSKDFPLEVEELPIEEISDGVENVAEPSWNEVKDTSPLLTIDASVEIPSEMLVPESVGSSIKVDESLKDLENEVVGEVPAEEAHDQVEAEPVLEDEKSMTIIDASTDKENGDENIAEPTHEMPTEAETNEPVVKVDEAEVVDEDVVAVGIDAPVENMVEEESIPEGIDAALREEDFRANKLEDVHEDSGYMDDVVKNEGDDDEVEEEVQPATLTSDERATVAGEDFNSVEEAVIKDADVEITEDDDGDDKDVDDDDDDDDDRSLKNEEKEVIDQSFSLEVGEMALESNDESMQTMYDSEADELVPREESNEEEDIVVEEICRPEESHDIGILTDEETTKSDEILRDSIALEEMEDDCLTISVVTWNLAEAAFSEKEASFFKSFRKGSSKVGSDLVLIGAQECEDIKPRRTEGHRSRHLRRVGIHMLGKDYVPLAIHSLGGIQMALYCHRDVLGDVEMVNIADVTCGVGNVFHNKGAIGVYLKMKRTDQNSVTKTSRILLATGHLAAHVKNVEARNDDFKRIISGLEEQAPARFLRPKRNPAGYPIECDGSHLLKSMDHVFFAGDLNYRVDLPREYVERCIIDIKRNQSCGRLEEAKALMNGLLRRDQLLQTIASGRAFPQFSEGKITFLPTFKFDKGTENYDASHKQRVPAWTDRILFRSSKVNVLEYQSVPTAMHSDHRPVFGTYQLGWGVTTKDTSRGEKRGRKRNRKR